MENIGKEVNDSGIHLILTGLNIMRSASIN